jgi:hypothetical protein
LPKTQRTTRHAADGSESFFYPQVQGFGSLAAHHHLVVTLPVHGEVVDVDEATVVSLVDAAGVVLCAVTAS